MSVSDIVTKYRSKAGGGDPLSLRKFADDLSAHLAPHGGVGYGAIYNWQAGKMQPDYWLLVYLTGRGGWPADMAREMLREIKPEVWAEQGAAIVGKE